MEITASALSVDPTSTASSTTSTSSAQPRRRTVKARRTNPNVATVAKKSLISSSEQPRSKIVKSGYNTPKIAIASIDSLNAESPSGSLRIDTTAQKWEEKQIERLTSGEEDKKQPNDPAGPTAPSGDETQTPGEGLSDAYVADGGEQNDGALSKPIETKQNRPPTPTELPRGRQRSHTTAGTDETTSPPPSSRSPQAIDEDREEVSAPSDDDLTDKQPDGTPIRSWKRTEKDFEERFEVEYDPSSKKWFRVEDIEEDNKATESHSDDSEDFEPETYVGIGLGTSSYANNQTHKLEVYDVVKNEKGKWVPIHEKDNSRHRLNRIDEREIRRAERAAEAKRTATPTSTRPQSGVGNLKGVVGLIVVAVAIVFAASLAAKNGKSLFG